MTNSYRMTCIHEMCCSRSLQYTILMTCCVWLKVSGLWGARMEGECQRSVEGSQNVSQIFKPSSRWTWLIHEWGISIVADILMRWTITSSLLLTGCMSMPVLECLAWVSHHTCMQGGGVLQSPSKAYDTIIICAPPPQVSKINNFAPSRTYV